MKNSTTKHKKNTAAVIAIQNASRCKAIPVRRLLQQWCATTLTCCKSRQAEICIRIVTEKEMAALNKRYRGKTGTTNVLSFQAAETGTPLLGDIVICAAVVNDEAIEQGKTRTAHWAHMVVHGTLHLLGHDHLKPADARKMESMEAKILRQSGFGNPYN